MVRGLLRWLAMAVAIALPAAAANPGTITGHVRNSRGVPQMGAAVEVFNATAKLQQVAFTDASGYYRLQDLPPGMYHVKVSAPSFLPTLRENVALKAGAAAVVNITLSTLFEALEILPAQGRSPQDEDDWKWTLRSVANRPILRVLDNGPVVVVSNGNNDKSLKAKVGFVAGSDAEGFGSTSDMNTVFNVEHSLFSTGTLTFKGSVGSGSGPTAGVLRASYSRTMSDGSRPEVALTVRRFATPDTVMHDGALQAVSFTASDTMTVAGFIDLHFGSELEAIQFMGRANAIRPFGAMDVHLGSHTVLEYQYTSTEPTMRAAKGFDTAPADLSESGPHMTLVEGSPALERARHQEISLSQRWGHNNLQLAGYSDHLRNTALTGVGDVEDISADLLPDVYSGTFSYNGGNLDTRGLRVVLQRKLAEDVTATLDYSYGGVLALTGYGVDWSSPRSSMRVGKRHGVTAKFAGTLPGTHTRWIASYKWMSGAGLSTVDAFNSSAGQADPYFNVFIRQPLPSPGYIPGRLEAIVDLRNLMAQGYTPVVGQDGHTLYLVQSARTVRGGLAFVF